MLSSAAASAREPAPSGGGGGHGAVAASAAGADELPLLQRQVEAKEAQRGTQVQSLIGGQHEAGIGPMVAARASGLLLIFFCHLANCRALRPSRVHRAGLSAAFARPL